MRFTRYTPLAMFIGTVLLTPVPAPAAANKDMEELQRDVADLEGQMKDFQKSLLDPKTGILTNLQSAVQQAQDTANKTNGTLNSLNSGIMQTLQTALKGVNDQLSSVVGLSNKVSGIGDDVSNLVSSINAMQTQINRQGQKLDDILNQIKVLQAPAAAPPGSDSGSPVAGVSPPPPTASTLFGNAVTDQNAAKYDLAITEFKQFLKLYPDDPSAIAAQFNIGESYYSLGKLDEAVDALDAVTEQYPKNERTTPSAEYMKGMTLKKQGKKTAAIASFRAVAKDFPHSDEAPQAEDQLRSLGVTATAPRKPSPTR